MKLYILAFVAIVAMSIVTPAKSEVMVQRIYTGGAGLSHLKPLDISPWSWYKTLGK